MKTPSQPRAIYYIVAIQIWEYFSFYGMRALLILYLTHQLGFDDSHAISLFSAYASLVYVTPILGGWLADRLLGNRTAVIAGALLMTLGHVVLGVVNVPMMDECFWAGLGMGAFRNGEPIHVSSAEVLSDAVVATGFPYAIAERLDDVLARLALVLPKAQGVRRIGAAWPMWPPGGRTPSTRCCSSPGTWLPAGCWWKKPAGGSRRWMDVRIPSGTRSWPATAWCTRNCGICWRP